MSIGETHKTLRALPVEQNLQPFGQIPNAFALGPEHSVLAPKDYQNIHAANPITLQNLSNRVLLFDIDGTVAGRIKKSQVKTAQELGYKVYEFGLDERGKADEFPYFIERPGAKEMLQNLKDQGFVLVASTRNFPHHVNQMLTQLGMNDIFFHTFYRTDLMSEDNQNFDAMPEHANNIGWLAKVKNWIHRMTLGKWTEFKRWLSSKFDKSADSFPEPVAGTLNKYPPFLCGARVLFDDKAENTEHASRPKSPTWYHEPVDHFAAHDVSSLKNSQEKDTDGEFKWVKKIYAVTNTLKNPMQGWKHLVKTKYKKDASTKAVPIKDMFRSKFQQKFQVDPAQATP